MILPILIALQLAGASIAVSSDKNIEMDCGIKSEYGLAGCYIPSSDAIVLNSDYEWLWKETVPHEYAHRVVIKNNLQNEIPLYFANSEDMANQFALYWNNPEPYSLRYPRQARWFRENFLAPLTNDY